MWVINPAVGCHYFPPGLQLPPQPLTGLLPFCCLVNSGTMAVNSMLRLLPDSVMTAIWTWAFCASVQHANQSATEPPIQYNCIKSRAKCKHTWQCHRDEMPRWHYDGNQCWDSRRKLWVALHRTSVQRLDWMSSTVAPGQKMCTLLRCQMPGTTFGMAHDWAETQRQTRVASAAGVSSRL